MYLLTFCVFRCVYRYAFARTVTGHVHNTVTHYVRKSDITLRKTRGGRDVDTAKHWRILRHIWNTTLWSVEYSGRKPIKLQRVIQ